jgi:hypothetical protein
MGTIILDRILMSQATFIPFLKNEIFKIKTINMKNDCYPSCEKVPGSIGCTLDTFKGISSIRRRRFDKTSSARSKLPENDIGSDKIYIYIHTRD